MAMIVHYIAADGRPALVTLPDGEPHRRETVCLGSMSREVAIYVGTEILLDEATIGGPEGPGG